METTALRKESTYVFTKIFTISILTGLSAFAQWGNYQTRNANIRGGGGDGKCTIEVEVDGAAEVEIRGTTARLRTRSGQRATWRRFDCNQAMPNRPNEFRFKGVDGRGRQDLVQDPGNGGPALVRIEDRKGGREGYTFDITWRGGMGGNNGGRDRRSRQN
jgi:hypothetical protein